MDKVQLTQLADLAERFLGGHATEEEIAQLHSWYDTADQEEIELVFTRQQESDDMVGQRLFEGLTAAIRADTEGLQAGGTETERFRTGISPSGISPSGISRAALSEATLSEAEISEAEVSRAGYAEFEEGESMPDQGAAKRRRVVPFGRPVRWAVAAAVIFVLVSAGILWKTRSASKAVCCAIPAVAEKKDIITGGNKASLVLGDGSVIDLEAAKNGTIRHEGGTTIDKRDGRVSYEVSKGEKIPVMNTIQTPRGGEYQVVLADGTKVWLNSASSLSYPTAFTGQDRQVELKGEAYFEVAPDKHLPFKVVVGGVQVDVLGTHFDIMAYNDEAAINTTLLEGAVRVAGGKGASLLAEGQQASFNKASSLITVSDVDVQDAVAWKDGYFQFSGVPIETVARQLTRWYDVDVEFEGAIDKHFRGRISRSVSVNEAIRMLELTGGAHFKTEGKKIIVMP